MKYSGHRTAGIRDFTKANYNLGSKDMTKALINASLEQQSCIKSNTHKARLPAIRLFGEFLKAETSVKRLNHIERTHVILFGESLREAYEAGTSISAVTARDYLSHVNCALAQARGDDKLRVNATKDLQFTPKNGIAKYDGSITEPQHQHLIKNASQPVSLIAQLQRHWGLRFREAALLDARKALKTLDEDGKLVVYRGTKGGQTRWIELESSHQRIVLERVANAQAECGHDSLVPKGQSFKAFQTAAWREIRAIDANYLTHGERKTYACDYYGRHVGVACPVRSGVAHGRAHHQFIANSLGISLQRAIAKDRAVRKQLSEYLGHHRVVITNSYLG
ncbi:integrase domain-containing protein [Vibrio sp. WXL210]|uniref:integrase domain-containing protein n=1 Tax=Vibrio sp. WXL210 TaxID=3450709 RepID=UPI003EC4C463